MIRSKSICGSLLFCVVLGLALAAPSGASAAQYKVEVAPAYLLGTQEGSQTFQAGAKVVCAAKDNEAVLKAIAAVLLALAPLFKTCTIAGQAATVNANGCIFEAGEPTGASSPYTVKTIGISCPAGKEIVVTATTAGCTIKIGGQTTTGTTTVTNNAGPPKTITFGWNVAGIKYTSSGGICGSSGTTGTYSGKEIMRAYSDEAHTKTTGIFVA